ncbi:MULTISPECIES: cupin domain-containing protein [unclassified Pseudomonas]|uniref:cupin domain-containing protein n=1 Tax=unclassified Pseudomonas TaxID=196821 RepID=UPI000F568020|nr:MULTISPECIES: cupin domain-containing protein [unclassified Pseudomonas]
MSNIEITDKKLFDNEIRRIGGGVYVDKLDALIFKPYDIDGRKGVSIFYLYDARINAKGPVAALIRYAGGALTPRHRHLGWELILVVDGELVDDRGRHAKGALQIYPPGSTHQLSSPSGCTFLVVWEQPVKPAPDQDAEAAV